MKILADILMWIVRCVLALLLGVAVVAACTLLARLYAFVIESLWEWGR